jgi:heterodisulfide reductase subunit A-like polyferredoxin
LKTTCVVRTDTPAIRESRAGHPIELLLAQAPDSKPLVEFAAKYGVRSTSFQTAKNGSCILCGLCVRTCNDLMGRGAINMFGRGARREVVPAYGERSNQCQVCGACEFVCPTGAVSLTSIASRPVKKHYTAYNQYLEARPNIDLAHPQAVPRVPSIDRDNCVRFTTGECGLCAEVCGAKAPSTTIRRRPRSILDVGAVLLTPGFEAFDARAASSNTASARNVITNVQFERLLSAAGPTQRPYSPALRRQDAQAARLYPVRRLARYGLRQRLLLLGLLHGRHQRGDPGKAA